MEECVVSCRMHHAAVYTSPRLGKRFDKKYLIATMKSQPSQMIWGTMPCSGAAGLYFIPPNTNMNGHKYEELFKEKLKLQMHVHSRYSCTMAFLVTDHR